MPEFSLQEGGREVLSPATDVFENEKEILLEVEMPGIPKSGVSVEFSNGVLKVSGRPGEAELPKGFSPLHLERARPSYVRAFALGPELDADRISARFEGGLLALVIPKPAKPERHPIKIY